MKTGAELIKIFENWLKDQGKSENTVITYRGVLQNFYQWLMETKHKDISKISKDDIQDYMNFLDKEQERSASTIDKVFATIRVFAQFLQRPEILNNIEKKKKEKNIYQIEPEYLNEFEKKKLLKQIEHDGNYRNIAIVYTLLFTGIRVSELCKLKHSDIKIKEKKGIVIINSSQDDKRIVPLSKEVIFHIQRYINSKGSNNGVLFESKEKHSLSPRAIQYMLKNYKINPVILRHTFCQDLINKGVDISVVAQLAGHNDLNMTKRYKKQIRQGHPINQASF